MDALKAQDPAHIGTYALLARLGAGGMGMVYLGRSPGGRLVALKVIKDEIVDHPEALARFRREAETVRAVRSAYTANLIDASLAAPPYWLATEYVSGPTLSRAVADRGPFPPDTCRRLFAALAEGLASVHAYGVTHRDLKPQNVILAPQGPQLIDFGIARGAADTALTQTGVAPGTPGFTAPEVLIRNEVGDPADVFALGATIAYAATGRAPFGAGSVEGVSYRAVHEPIDVSGVEPELAALILACAAKDPAERPTPAEVIVRCAVTSALAEDPYYQALTTGLAEAAPHDLPTAMAAGLVPAGHGTPTMPPGYTPTLAPQLPTHPLPTRSRRTPWIVTIAVAAVLGVVAALSLRMLPGGKGDGGGGQAQGASKSPAAGGAQSPGPTGHATPAGTDTKPVGPPQYIEQTAPSLDGYSALSERCRLPMQEEVDTQFQFSVTTGDMYPTDDVPPGKVKIGYRLKYEEPGAPPYYIAMTVKPPHEVDADGNPTSRTPNRQLGFVSKAADLYAGNQTEWKYLTYPDDFSYRVGGKVLPALPISRDTETEWTVVYQHVKGPKDYKSVVCSGFNAK
ncbi:serine/threonine-protein kinase [Streptomyces sp. BR1]|uniref:serine/threonine-protein kinase n=1 Tax=Streptomyces sp. BR1 TaxID=1592323 RepID=UPI00402B8556